MKKPALKLEPLRTKREIAAKLGWDVQRLIDLLKGFPRNEWPPTYRLGTGKTSPLAFKEEEFARWVETRLRV